ncbi:MULTISPECIES: AlpA family transcriptional regulator [unclassified Brevundimonas]|uniref:helix-turn-helix transcriptional regulator n=1 Tax=unclassified Brevundimonas TaxID=2622653 RepID=UPI0025B7AC09|nr:MULTISPECIES: AlpA family phage regulatory protein [unclassified Brevundimonas]
MTAPSTRSPVETGGSEDRLLPWGRVHDIAGISRTTAWRMQQTGDFPAPVSLSPGRVGWWESELTAWKGARSAAKPLSPPMKPRLPGMPQKALMRPANQPPAISNAQDGVAATVRAPPRSPAEPLSKSHGRRRRARGVHVDQIDFGF